MCVSRTVPLSAKGKIPCIAAFVVLKKSGRLGVVHCDEIIYMYYIGGLLNPTQLICNLTGESRAIHDCSVADMPQIKKMGVGGEVEAQCLIKIGKRKKSVVLIIKLSERGEYCVYFYLYKSKCSTINIQFSYLNFKNFHLHPRQETNKQKSGAI